MFQYTGNYTKHPSKRKYGIEYYTFTPSPLLNGVPIIMDEELFSLLATAHRLLGTLEGMALYMPNSDIIKQFMLLKECYYSRLIDWNNTPAFHDVLKGLSANRDDIRYITNTLAAQKYAFGKTVGKLELSKICNIIINGPDAGGRIEIRDKQIFLRNAVSNLMIYSPTAPGQILPTLLDIFKFLITDNHTDIFVKAALAHYQFEIVHPYECCNGLIGRIMMSMILFNGQYQAAPYLCLSEYLYHNRSEYFNILSSTQAGNGYLYLIKFFMHAICVSASRTLERIKRLEKIIETDEKKIAALNQSTKSVAMVYNYFKMHLVSEIKPISTLFELSYNTVAKAVDSLLAMNVLQIKTEQSRHRLFQYGALTEVLCNPAVLSSDN